MLARCASTALVVGFQMLPLAERMRALKVGNFCGCEVLTDLCGGTYLRGFDGLVVLLAGAEVREIVLREGQAGGELVGRVVGEGAVDAGGDGDLCDYVGEAVDVIAVDVGGEEVVEGGLGGVGEDVAGDPLAGATGGVGAGGVEGVGGGVGDVACVDEQVVPSGKMRSAELPRAVSMWWMSKWPSVQAGRGWWSWSSANATPQEVAAAAKASDLRRVRRSRWRGVGIGFRRRVSLDTSGAEAPLTAGNGTTEEVNCADNLVGLQPGLSVGYLGLRPRLSMMAAFSARGHVHLCDWDFGESQNSFWCWDS